MLPWHEVSMYDHPEEFGLELVAEAKIELDGYEGVCTGSWTMIAVWRTKSGVLLAGHDTACDCPTPFENTRVEELFSVADMDELEEFVWAHWGHLSESVVRNRLATLALG